MDDRDGAERRPEEKESLYRAIERRQRQKARWEREGERPVWKNMSMIGSLGWLITVPILIGIFVGRFLDRAAGQGISWTASLIFLGAAVGFYLAWKKVTGD